MSTPNWRRLRTLANFLDGLRLTRTAQFDLREWCKKTTCGTTACAMGWACRIPSFRRAGLRSVPSSFYEGVEVPFYGHCGGFNAAMQFFGISYSDALYLFESTSYPIGRRGRASVVRRLRQFIKNRGRVAT